MTNPHSLGASDSEAVTHTGSPAETGVSLPHADAVLDAPEEGCATLTPLIRARMRKLESGQILDVRTDDPTAHDNLQAWCRLTGHTLVAVGDTGAHGKRFLIRKQ